MLSPSVPVTTPEGASLPNARSRRRGLNYLRNLSTNRSPGATGSDSSRTSPRSYFQRSTSYTEPKNRPRNTNSRTRSNSRPTEITSALADGHTGSQIASVQINDRRSNTHTTSTELRRSRSSEPTDGVNTPEPNEDNIEHDMARRRPTSSRRAVASTQQMETPAEASNETPSITRPVSSRAAATTTGSDGQEGDGKSQLPTIRFFPHQEHRNGRQSLNFTPVSRTLPGEHCIVRVGRYSEREGVPTSNPTAPSDAPVGFKSKVVSRKHCEFSFVDGQWHIKDVASSSGTFLNHIRLSQPSTESRLFPIKDGDIVQLGIDFRGGEEMIFRCVKMRIECNRAWQKKPNTFNKSRHAQLQSLAKDQVATGTNSGECSICLGSVLPCQSLFVAPCAHVWHYKCIRPLLEGKNSTYPQFQCPNCRAYTDLTADVEVAESDMDEWMGGVTESSTQNTQGNGNESATAQDPTDVSTNGDGGGSPPAVGDEPTDEPSRLSLNGSNSLLARRQAANATSSEIQSFHSLEMPVRMHDEELNNLLEEQRTRTETPEVELTITGEGPLTPRNNAGPFVFDGSAATGSGRRLTAQPMPGVAEDES